MGGADIGPGGGGGAGRRFIGGGVDGSSRIGGMSRIGGDAWLIIIVGSEPSCMGVCSRMGGMFRGGDGSPRIGGDGSPRIGGGMS